MLEETAAQYPEKAALHQPLGGGKYRTWTWREYRDTVQQIAVGVRELGVPKGGMVALESETRAEFYLTDIGIMTSGVFARIRAEVSEFDMSVLYMISSATGEPKMGLVAHRELVANMDMTPVAFPLLPNVPVNVDTLLE